MIALLCGVVLAECLIYGGIAKVRDLPGTYLAFEEYTAFRSLPAGMIGAMAFLVPIAELAIGGALLLFPDSGLVVASAGAMLLVTSLTVLGDERDEFRSCGCGVAHAPATKALVLARLSALATLLVVTAIAGGETEVSGVGRVAVALQALPFAVLIMELPQMLHVIQVQRRELHSRVQRSLLQYHYKAWGADGRRMQYLGDAPPGVDPAHVTPRLVRRGARPEPHLPLVVDAD